MDYPMDACKESEPANENPVRFDEAQLHTSCPARPVDFDSWVSIIAETEKLSPVEAEKIFLAYESFLSEFPLCYAYWRKYAGHKARFCSVDKVVEVFERAVQLATYSVHLWVDYCCFGMLLFEDPTDVRRLFERGISFVGKDYLCYLLWDKYIEFEYSQKQWSSLAHIHVRTLKYPSKKLNSYYDSFKKLATCWEEEIKLQGLTATEVESDGLFSEVTDTATYDEENMSLVIRDLLDPAIGLHRSKALKKYLSTGESLYVKANHMDAKISYFETRIRRPYFHVKSLDVSQLENWHQYLDFVEMQEDFDWIVKLYERCLIPCANYLEFWMRYVEFMETKGGREIAEFALLRATQIFLKRIPATHLFCARFKEKIGDAVGSRAAFRQCDSDLNTDFVENVRRKANMEKRLGKHEAAFDIYEKAIEMAGKRWKEDAVSILYVHFSRFKYMVTGRADAARDVLNKGVQHFPCSKILLEGLLNFEMMHRGPKQMNILDSIVSHAIFPVSHSCRGLNDKDREDISNLYLELVDHCGTIHDIAKAWTRHVKLFPNSIRPASYSYTLGRQDMGISVCYQASGNFDSHGSVQPLGKDQKNPLSENPDILPDLAITVEPHLEDKSSPNDTLQLLESPRVTKQPELDLSKQSGKTCNLTPEVSNSCKDIVPAEQSGETSNLTSEVSNGCKDMVPAKQSGETSNLTPKVSNSCKDIVLALEYHSGQDIVQTKADSERDDDIGPPSLETLSLSSKDGEPLNFIETTPNCIEIPENPCPSGSNQQSDDNTAASVSPLSGMTCQKFDNSAQIHDQSAYFRSNLPTNPSSLQMRPPTQQFVPPNAPSDHNPVNYTRQAVGESLSGIHGPQTSTSSTTTGFPTAPISTTNNTNQPIPRAQNFRWQPPSLQNPHMLPGNQAPNHYPVAVAPGQPWPAHIQQQYFASSAQSQLGYQPVSYPHPQVYQYQQQNYMQYGQVHGNQTYAPNTCHYYYPPQQQPEQNQPPHLQPQQHHQHMTHLQMQTWNNNYYQQQAAAQHYGSNHYMENSQQATGSQAPGTTPQNIDPSIPPIHPYAQQQIPPQG